MRRLIFLAVIVFSLAPTAFGASALYKMRNGDVATTMGRQLMERTNRLCDDFALLQSHFASMTEQRDDTTDFTTVAAQWGVIDVTTNAPSEASAEAMYAELNSFIGNAGPSLSQWCARVRQ